MFAVEVVSPPAHLPVTATDASTRRRRGRRA